MPRYISASDVIPHQVVGASNQNANFPKGNPRVAATHKYASTKTTAIEVVVNGRERSPICHQNARQTNSPSLSDRFRIVSRQLFHAVSTYENDTCTAEKKGLLNNT